MRHREYWDIVDGARTGILYLDKYEQEITPQTLARSVGEEGRKERAYLAQQERAKVDEKAPHHFAMTECSVRSASHAEVARKEQEKATLQFLRGGKG